MIVFSQKGDFRKATSFLEKLKEVVHLSELDKYGKAGVEALRQATPIDSGETANSWYYKIEHGHEQARLLFCNSHINEGVPIAIILQFGHGTGTGGWVEGRDYINPAIQPVFDKLADDAWREVTSL